MPGCVATVRGLDARADLNEFIVKLLELDEDTSRGRAETLDGVALRIKGEKLFLHRPP